jgi:hypothetical protein
LILLAVRIYTHVQLLSIYIINYALSFFANKRIRRTNYSKEIYW